MRLLSPRHVAVASLLALAQRAPAQRVPTPAAATPAAPTPPAPPGPPLARHALLRRSATTLGAFAAATAVAFPLDRTITRAARSAGPQGSGALHDGARVFNTAGDPGALVASVALLGVGRLVGDTGTARLGLHATEAVVASGTISAVAKLLAGRQRPNVETGDADDFVPLRGYRAGRTSFPSGHTTVAFAFAAAVTSDLRARHARAARLVGPLLYTAAGLVGAARIYDEKHWMSDVLLGAGIGTVTGQGTVALARAHPHGWLEGLAGRTPTGP